MSKLERNARNSARLAGRCLVGMMSVVLVAAILIPNHVNPPGGRNATGCVNACINFLRQIDGAKELYCLQNVDATDAPVMSRLVGPGNYIKSEPRCPAGGQYTIGSRDTPPVCSVSTHVLL